MLITAVVQILVIVTVIVDETASHTLIYACMVTVESTAAVIVPVLVPIESFELSGREVEVPGISRSNVHIPPVIEE